MEVWIWGAAGLVLVILEVMVPGYFLVFPALAAFVMALADLAGITGIEGQLAVFAAAAALLFLGSAGQYRRFLSNRPNSLVNLPQRLVGRHGIVEDPLIDGRGKIRLGDSVWLASGPDLPKGSPVRVAAVEGTVLQVEAAE